MSIWMLAVIGEQECVSRIHHYSTCALKSNIADHAPALTLCNRPAVPFKKDGSRKSTL